jgi:hypothetical protein
VSAGLLLVLAVVPAWGQYGGLFVSATPKSPILPGQALDIAVVVRNTSDEVWAPGEGVDYSWFTQVDQPSWCGGCPAIWFVTATIVNLGVTAGMTVTLSPADLPSAPGSYSIRLVTAYNWLDVYDSVMDGSPKTVSFTMSVPATNHAPVIVPIGDKAVVETNLLSFKVTATDTDLPPQTLTFSLEPGTPPGAAINSSNGTFTWTPPAGTAPHTNEVTVRVVDNGSPPLSATNTFKAVVLKPPRFLSISQPTNEVITLVWESFPGKSYRVRFKEDLGLTSWTNLGVGDLVATNVIASTTNRIGPAGRRFYQLLLQD